MDDLRTVRELLDELDTWRIRAARGTGKKRVPLRELAAASGIPRSSLSDYLSGTTLMPADALDAVVLALGATAEQARQWADAWESATAEQLRRSNAGSSPRAEFALPDNDVPRQLPSGPGHFTGRRAELDEVVALARDAGAHAGAVVISAIDGMAGIGKTALALHAAHQLAPGYPDGQLFIDLHGYTEGHPPRTAEESLAWLLQGLGVSPQRIPKDTEQAAALFRQRLAGTKTLIVLDNAATEAQVRPLLPGTSSCLVLVTSRKRLKALDDAHNVSLDVLAPDDAVALLRLVAGSSRIPADDQVVNELAALCGHLPLALRIAGALLRHRPSWPIEHLVAQLRDQRQRVSALADGERDLSSVFDLSYTSLDATHQTLWRRLGLVPGPDMDGYAAAALADITPAEATRGMEDLVDHNLLIAYAPGRYRLHDLLRAHARTLVAAEHDAAIDRLFHYYAHTAQAASVPIARFPRPEPTAPAPEHSPALTDADQARSWLRTEHANLDAAFAYAAANGLDDHTIALAAGMAEILVIDGPWTRALDVHQAAVSAAAKTGNAAAEANALTDLGRTQYMADDYPPAIDSLTKAVEAHRALGNRLGEGAALTDLTRVRNILGEYPAAVEAVTRALEIFRDLGHRLGEAAALSYLGRTHYLTGGYAEAIEASSQTLEIFRELGHRDSEAIALTHLGQARYVTADFAGALEAATRALEIFRELGNEDSAANALADLARVWHAIGDYPKALDTSAQALKSFRALGRRTGEAAVLADMGRVRMLTGDHPGAAADLNQALEMFAAMGNRNNVAYALTNLGLVHLATADHAKAAEVLTQALDVYRALGYRGGEAWALNCYARALAAGGDRLGALAIYEQALAMNRELNKPDDAAASLEGIADHYLAAGEHERGSDHLRQALEVYQSLGMAADARRVQERLDTVDD